MIGRIRGKLSFANVMSMTAVMIALGGTSYAAAVARNSVGSSQIRPKAVKNSDLGDSAVTSGKVKNGALRAQDFALGQIPVGARGATGAPGATGPAGPQGPIGLTGTPGADGVDGADGLLSGVVVRRVDVALPAGDNLTDPGFPTSGFATCAAGEQIIGGSASIGNVADPPTQEIVVSRPSVNTTGNGGQGDVPANGGSFAFWKGTGRTLKNEAGSMRVFAFCATP